MYVHVGNATAIEGFRDPTSNDPGLLRFKEAPGERVTSFSFPNGMNLRDALNSVIVSLDHQMARGTKPVWIESDVAALEDMLVAHYAVAKNKRPRTWGQEVVKAEVAKAADATTAVGTMGLTMMIAQVGLLYVATQLALKTRAGTDWQARVMGDPASNATGAYASATFVGITANDDAPDVDDAALTGEVVAGSLIRAQAVYSHTNGTNPYTLTKPFVSDQSITIAKMGVFTAVTGGTLVFEALLNAVSVMEPGDTTNITETVTLN